MKTNTTLAVGLIIGLTLAGTALAGSDNGNGNGGNNNGKGNGGSPPAAPEPGLLLMVASGLALGGGYLLWRSKQKNAPAM